MSHSTPAHATDAEVAKSIALEAVTATIAAREVASALEGVAQASRAQKEADRLLIASVVNAKAEGASWAQIGDLLGTTRSAAQSRFGKHVRATTEEPEATRKDLAEAWGKVQQLVDAQPLLEDLRSASAAVAQVQGDAEARASSAEALERIYGTHSGVSSAVSDFLNVSEVSREAIARAFAASCIAGGDLYVSNQKQWADAIKRVLRDKPGDAIVHLTSHGWDADMKVSKLILKSEEKPQGEAQSLEERVAALEARLDTLESHTRTA